MVAEGKARSWLDHRLPLTFVWELAGIVEPRAALPSATIQSSGFTPAAFHADQNLSAPRLGSGSPARS